MPTKTAIEVGDLFAEPLTVEAAVKALARVYGEVIRAEAGSDVPLRELAVGIHRGRPILQITKASGRQSTFGYVWAFDSGRDLDEQMEFFFLRLNDPDSGEEPEWDGEEVEQTLKLACLAIVAYQWMRHPSLQPAALEGGVTLFDDMEGDEPIHSLQPPLEKKALREVLGHFCREPQNRELLEALSSLEPSHDLMNAIRGLGRDEQLDALLPPPKARPAR